MRVKLYPVFLLPLACLLLSCATAPNKALAAEWYEIGNSWYDQGKWAKAGASYSRAMRLDPGLVAASYNLARALVEAGDYDGALASLDAVLASDGKNVRGLSLQAYILWKKGDAKAALETYDKVLELDPYAPDAIYNASLLREATGDYAGAIAAIEPLARTRPEDATLGAFYGRVLAEGGRSKDAIAAFEKVGALGKLSAADYESLGALYAEGRDFVKAMAALESSVGADPKRAAAWFALARLRLAQAEDGKAGLDALGKALAAGFKDKDAASLLLEEPVLAEREAVTAALRESGLVE